MNLEILYTFLGLSLPVIFGGTLSYFIKLSENRLKLLLAFSAAYLLALLFVHLLPEIYSGNNSRTIGIYILIGFFIQLGLDFLSTGIEHGHLHVHHDHGKKAAVPVFLIFGLFFHSFLEGMPVSDFVMHNPDEILSIKSKLIAGITFHNIPVAFAFVTLLRFSKLKNSRIFLLLFLFSMMAPLGALLSEWLKTISSLNFEFVYQISLGIVVGIFLHIATTIMFESSENHKYNIGKIISILAGSSLAYFLN